MYKLTKFLTNTIQTFVEEQITTAIISQKQLKKRSFCTKAKAKARKKMDKAVLKKPSDLYTDLSGKSIMVTGCALGIGYAIVERLTTVGAHVVAVDINDSLLKRLATELKNIDTVQADLSDWEEARRVLTSLEFANGLDGLVNNAGCAVVKPFEDLTEHDIDKTFALNFKGPFITTQSMLEVFNENASIVMVSAIESSKAMYGHCVHGPSKTALNSLTQNLALELGVDSIRVNSVNPTIVWTDQSKQVWADPKKHIPLMRKIPLGRFCEMTEIVDAICFLLSSRSSFINGHHLNLEGGLSV